MTTALPVAVVASVAVVAWGVGGYAPWAMLALELSALALAGWLIATILFRTSRAERERNIASVRGARADVEIFTPPSTEDSPSEDRPNRSFREPLYVFGYPFRRVGSGVVILVLTAWIVLSLVPIRVSWLSVLSPKALQLRSDVETMLGSEEAVTAPFSLTPFLSYQDLLLWLAYVMLFWVTFHLAESPRSVRRLTLGLAILGIASGTYGLVQWLSRFGAAHANGGVTSFVATGTFGNRNHYAFFQEMLLLVGVGWLLLRWAESERRARDRTSAQEAKARAALFALGVLCIALGLIFSLSRSGLTFALMSGAFFFFATRDKARGASGRMLAVVALSVVAAALWIGIDPVVSRFEVVANELTMEDDGRATVWRDSIGAVSDFWLTGSGLSSFQYVYPVYRSFGGRRFYSWAHNDYLQLAIELGLPGLLLCVFLIIWIVRRAWRVRQALSAQQGLRDLHAGYCAAALAVALHSFTDFGLHLPANAALFAVVLGVVTGLSPERGSAKRKKRTKRKKLRRSPPSV